jgi:hydrogenase nickel incorporation protein HypA/HybF
MTVSTDIYYENGTLIMHELSVANSIISSLEKLKAENGFEILRKVDLSIGRLSGVNSEALRLALDSLRKDTILGDVQLEIREECLRIKCNDCGKETDIQDYNFACEFCGKADYEIISGDSLEITEIEVD